jgi:hypothetical protein
MDKEIAQISFATFLISTTILGVLLMGGMELLYHVLDSLGVFKYLMGA